MTVSEYIVYFIKSKGIGCVFELSGGMIMDLIDTLHVDGEIEIINVHHEQAAAFAADSVGRLSAVPGIAIATSGPGATNLLTGIGSCFFDSSPALFITGQVKTNEQKGDRKIRQLGFQETDIVSMASPITKSSFRVLTVDEIPKQLEQAYQLSISGRPGPVLIDIPMDFFRQTIAEIATQPSSTTIKVIEADDRNNMIALLLEDIRVASRPLILVGGGVRASNSFREFLEFISIIKIPTVWSLMASDVIPRDHECSVGMIGTYGNRWANLAVAESDLILVLGSRLDIRQTGANTKAFKRGKIIYQVDIEAEEINNRVKGCIPIISDLKLFLCNALTAAKKIQFKKNEPWIKYINNLKVEWPDIDELKDIKGINPNYFMRRLSERSGELIYSVDVGQHQMWAAQSIQVSEGQRFLTSGGMGAMGFALPAAIGAAFHTQKAIPVVAIAGDAGFQLTIQELQTVVRNRLPIKIIVINNKCHGMTRQFQETYFQARYQATVWGYDAPDFESVAKAYKIKAATVSETENIVSALDAFWRDPHEPYLLQVMIDTYTNVYPKLAFGKEISDMEPLAQPIEMEGT